MTDKNTINRINFYSEEQIPFLFIIDFDIECPVVIPLQEINASEIQYDINGRTNSGLMMDWMTIPELVKNPVTFEEYLAAFDLVKENIDFGNSFLVNLTFPTRVHTALNLSEIFLMSRAPYKLRYKDHFVVFSPEPFIRIKNDSIFSYPMKGTQDASEENAEEKLLSDEKEIAEHNTIVDLIRNDLNMVAKNVEVSKFRYVEKIRTHEKTLLQTSSEICGTLAKDWRSRLGETLFSILPAGSVTGAPKKKTVEIIKKAEKYKRGFFTGIFGIYDGNSVESAVMIRFIEKTGGGLYFKSGGGITCFSKPQSEYKEMIDKVYLPVS